ncbi:MAG: hypothetical protein K8J31_18125, partial [Anaerolineae bacterium]|nr:hypothetical protein [Anaerolineae bacterium]
GMWVILYDEGMYPSGSSSGQVVAQNQAYQCRGMVRINLDTAQPGSSVQGVTIGADGDPNLAPDQTLVTIADYQGQRYAIVDRPIDSVIRGLHYLSEEPAQPGADPPEDSPPAADLLNPEAVACFIRLVYDRFDQEFGDYFGTTVRAIFTDEPMLLGRPREKGILPGTTGLLEHLNRFLGTDFGPSLPALWDDQAPPQIREDFERALEHRLQQTYYQQLYDWCEGHGIALTGHPAEADATAHLRFFHWPGQDIVWRWVEPDSPTALEGRQSTQAKAAASVMLHEGRRRNANEFCGAFGHSLTFDEMRWLANWLLVRGCNLLIPHAFYYSVRGPRRDERPPDVGPNSPWWDDGFTALADASRRLCWLNTDSEQICSVAILGENHRLPWRAAKVCFENQVDFNYVDLHDLLDKAEIGPEGICIAGQQYAALIVDDVLPPGTETPIATLEAAGRLVRWTEDAASCLEALRRSVPAALQVDPPSPGLRVRQVRKAGLDWLILFNEGAAPVDAAIKLRSGGAGDLIDPMTGETAPFAGRVQLAGHDLRVLVTSVR